MKTVMAIILFFSLSGTSWSICEKKNVSFHITDPIDRSPWDVNSRSFHPNLHQFPVIFILPPISGSTILDDILALNFCLHGMGADILNVVRDFPIEIQIQDLNYENQRMIRAKAAVSSVIDSLVKEENISGRFGIMGSSQGGVFTAYIAGKEPRLNAHVIIVGGGNLPGILAYGQEEEVNKLRKGRMDFFNLKTPEEYEAFLQKIITEDPLNGADDIAPGTTYQFIANRDETIPTHYQHQLKKIIPRPLVYVMHGGHVDGVIKASTIHKHKIINFFLNRLMPK